jgi:hypothetical protein
MRTGATWKPSGRTIRSASASKSSEPAAIAAASLREAFRAIEKPGIKIVFEAPTVPLGNYARAALRAMSSDPAYGRTFAANVVSLMKSTSRLSR